MTQRCNMLRVPRSKRVVRRARMGDRGENPATTGQNVYFREKLIPLQRTGLFRGARSGKASFLGAGPSTSRTRNFSWLCRYVRGIDGDRHLDIWVRHTLAIRRTVGRTGTGPHARCPPPFGE